jgi:hypothetical protein
VYPGGTGPKFPYEIVPAKVGAAAIITRNSVIRLAIRIRENDFVRSMLTFPSWCRINVARAVCFYVKTSCNGFPNVVNSKLSTVPLYQARLLRRWCMPRLAMSFDRLRRALFFVRWAALRRRRSGVGDVVATECEFRTSPSSSSKS